MDDGLNAFKPEFKRVVLSHIKESLSPGEWASLREHAMQSRSRIVDETPVPEASPAELVAETLSSSGMTVADVLSGHYASVAIQIGLIQGQPVYYLKGEGYYFWGLYPDTGFLLDITLTWPAYPPNW